MVGVKQDKSGRMRYALENHTHGESSAPLSRVVGAKPRQSGSTTGIFSGVVSGGGTSQWGLPRLSETYDAEFSGYPIGGGLLHRYFAYSREHTPPDIDLSSPWEIYHRKMTSMLVYNLQGVQAYGATGVTRDLHTVRGFTIQFAFGSMSAVGGIESVFECDAGLGSEGWSQATSGDYIGVKKLQNDNKLYWRSRVRNNTQIVPTGLTYQPDILYWVELTCNSPSKITGTITSQAGDATYTWPSDRCPAGNLGPFLQADGNQRNFSGTPSSWGWHKIAWTQPW